MNWIERAKFLRKRNKYINIELERCEIERLRWKEGDLSDKFNASTNYRHISDIDEVIEQLQQERRTNIKELEYIKLSLSELDDVEHKVLVLKHIEGLGLKEIAQELGYTYQYIRLINSKATKKIS